MLEKWEEHEASAYDWLKRTFAHEKAEKATYGQIEDKLYRSEYLRTQKLEDHKFPMKKVIKLYEEL